MTRKLLVAAELHEVLGVTRSRAGQLIRSGRLPEPWAQTDVRGYPIWERTAIERWDAKRKKKEKKESKNK